MNVFFDLETLPSQDPAVKAELAAAVTAPAKLSKPESIAEWLAANRESEAEAAWLKTSFDGGVGQACVIGWAIEDEEPQSLQVGALGREDEADMIEEWFRALHEVHRGTSGTRPCFVGHNIIGFDLPFLWKRAMVLNVKPPLWFPRNPKPWSDVVCDTMLLWDSTQRAGGSMDRLCRLLGISGKGDMDGSKVWPMVRDGQIDAVSEYCRDDVERTRAMYRRMNFLQAA